LHETTTFFIGSSKVEYVSHMLYTTLPACVVLTDDATTRISMENIRRSNVFHWYSCCRIVM